MITGSAGILALILKLQAGAGRHHELNGHKFAQTFASLVAQTVKRLPAMWETKFLSWVGKIPWRRKWQPIPEFLPGKSH